MVFDREDFAVAEDVQKGFGVSGDPWHTIGLEEGVLAIFQQSVDRAIGRDTVEFLAGDTWRQAG